MKLFKSSRGFTLIELLIVIGILAILATVVVLVLNPAQLFQQSRDGVRMAELNAINKALSYYQSFGGVYLGELNKIYVSIPSANADCSGLGLPAPSGGYTYACSSSANYRKVDGTGWIPINFTLVQAQAGSLFPALPIDPINTVANGYYYTYIRGSWALSATMESQKYIAANAANDGGQVSTRFELGNELALNANLTRPWTCADTLVDSRDSKIYSTVLIGTQCWTAQNLDYDNGCSSKVWVNLTDVGWCGYYTGGPFVNEGLLYQWSAAMNGSTIAGAQGICPIGWHIPTHDQWTTLERAVCTSASCATDFPYDITTSGWRGSDEGTKLKSGGTSGFNVFLVGLRNTDGAFGNRTLHGYIWSSVESGVSAWMRYLGSGFASVSRNASGKAYGFSVRCLKD